MSTGVLSPSARLRELSDLGVILPGALLNTYVSGTPATPLATYNDVALTIPNENPVVASAGGLFGPIYLTPGVAYKFVLTDAAGAPIWTQDPIGADLVSPAVTAAITAAVSAATSGLIGTGTNDFRLSLESGVPVSSTDQLAKTTLFWMPSGRGNRVQLYDATGLPTTMTSGQISIAIPASTSQLYDVFVWNNGGVPTLELLAWTNDTTRATALVLTTTGTYTKSGDFTRRYVGSCRTTTVSGQTEDSVAKRYVWNYTNRVRRVLRRIETTDTWTYGTDTWRQANAAAANQVDVVVGIADTPIQLMVLASHQDANGNSGAVSIGEDSTTAAMATALSSRSLDANGTALNVNFQSNVSARVDAMPAIGRHFYAWLERNLTGTITWIGTGAATQRVGCVSGMTGSGEG